MKKNDKFLLIAAAGLVAYWIYSKSRALASLVFAPGNVSGISLSGGSPVVTLSVTAQNTSTSSLNIESFAGNIFSNGTLIGNVSNFSPVAVPANTQIVIPLTAVLQPLGIVNDLIQAFQNNSFTQKITVNGYANVNGIQLPLNLDFAVGA